VRRILLAGCAAGLILAAPASAFIGEGDLILRPQALPLGQDLSLGRFGGGDLFFDGPADVATDLDDRAYILDAGNRRIQVTDEKGDFVTKWSLGPRSGFSKDEAQALALDGRRKSLFVLDRARSRVQKFSLSGELLATFGVEGLGRGAFDDPVDLAVDGYGAVYVLDRGRRMVLKFSPDGVFRAEFGGGGEGRDRLIDPVSLACIEQTIGFVLVLDAGGADIVRFDRDGEFRDRVPLPAEARGGGAARIRVDRWDGLFILDAKERKLIKSSQRGVVQVFSLEGGKVPVEAVGGVAIDRKNRLYVTDLRKNRVVRFLLEQP
jgi:uncharacterized protein YjiK